LILTEADLYNKIGDEVRFASLMQEAIAQDPNNAVLYYNLGVVNSNKGNRETSISYYKKAIELDPNYEATYLNLASVILEGEAEIVEQMNALGNSASENRKYDVLKQMREGLFLEAVPYLETLVSINPKNADALTTLKNIFGTIGDTANFKKYRDMLDSL
jgi:tetratricopeptide (TPR) repeat protein